MEKLYNELFDVYKNRPLVEYEKRAAEVKEAIKDKDFHFSYESFVPYPAYKNKDFNKIILQKQEFYRNRSRWDPKEDYDSVVDDKCKGEFRSTPYQKFLKNFMSPMTPYRSLLVYHSVGTGKCMSKDTPVLMFTGETKAVQDIVPGDLLMGDDSTPRTVLSIASGEAPMYEIQQSHGETYTVNDEHILVLKDAFDRILEIEVRDFIKLPENVQASYYGYSTFVEFPSHETYEDPYIAGTSYDGTIAYEHLINDSKHRFKYLMGIVHKHGSYSNDSIVLEIPPSEDLKYLGRSLGFSVTGDAVTTFWRSNLSELKISPKGVDTYYGFEIDGNRRFVLGGFTVTHNTCTAVNIAEQYYDTYEKRVLVILSGTLEENFKKQIFDITKVTQCTGNKYPSMVLDYDLLTTEQKEKKIDAVIKQRYEFMGYKELAIFLEKKKREIKEQVRDPSDPAKLPEIELKRQVLYEEIIRDKFSNRLIIIDEAHNLRLPSETGNKQISTAFSELVHIIENVKLVLMTATPMYNTADEIVWMVNLLLTNDRAPTVKRSDLFDKDSNLTPKGRTILKEITRGYVSYMRGENPYSFPFRLFPSINDAKDPRILKKYPSTDIYGSKIPEDEKVRFLEIITSKMSDYQYKVYNSFKKKIKEITDEDLEMVDEEKDTNDVQNTMQLSNVAYPEENWEQAPRKTYGLAGFTNCFKVSSGKTFKVSYLDHVKEKYGEFLSYKKLDTYAPKIKAIVDYIKNAKGIVFIYSRYYGAGIFPLVCALEHAGMVRYSVDGKSRAVLDGATIEDQFGGKRPKYVVLSRKNDLSPDNDKEIAVAKSAANMNGEIVKVIIVSKIGTEGIDFKRIREVHILEPWYNLNRAEQIIGRAVRTCSHIDLPRSERNVTIYFHANVCPGDEESVDLRTYRISENKQKRIIEVEEVLKQGSIDCNLNRDVLMFPKDKLKVKFDIVTAQGKTIKDYEVGDRDYSFVCGFKKCAFKCDPVLPFDLPVDNTTFDIDFISDDVQLMKRYISSIYQANPKHRTHRDIIRDLNSSYKLIEEDIVNFALEEMVTKKETFKLPKGDAYLIYRSDKYVMQYETLDDVRMSIEERMDPSREKRLLLDVSKMKKPAAVAVEMPAEAAVEPKVSDDNSVDEVYAHMHAIFLAFLTDLEVSDPGPTIAYLVSKDREAYEEAIYKHLSKRHSASGKASSDSVKRIKAMLDRYKSNLLGSVLDRCTADQLYKISFEPSSEVQEQLKKHLVSMGWNVGKFVFNPLDKKLYKKKGASVVECGPTEIIAVLQEYNKLTAQVTDKPPPGKRCYTIWQKGKLTFKVRETDSTSGAVCDSSPPKEKILENISRHMKKGIEHLNTKSYTKQWLCVILEIVSRSSNEFQMAANLASKS